MSDTSDSRESGAHHRYGVVAAVAAATLTLIAAIIGLITVFVQDDPNPENVVTGTAITETIEANGGKAPPDTDEGSGSLDPAHDGNSRASAKRLPGDRTIYSSLVAGNDEDWYVYEVPKDETATVEVAPLGEEASSQLIDAVLWEGLEEIDSSTEAISGQAFVVPRLVSAGTRLFVRVADNCMGCSIEPYPYKVEVRTSPPG